MAKRRGCLKAVRASLIMALIFIVGLWGLLRIFDPLGVLRYYNDLSRLFADYVVSERGYSMYPGLHQYSNWTALIERNGNRHVPDGKNAACEIAFVGDSVTFGFGVQCHVAASHASTCSIMAMALAPVSDQMAKRGIQATLFICFGSATDGSDPSSDKVCGTQFP